MLRDVAAPPEAKKGVWGRIVWINEAMPARDLIGMHIGASVL